MKTSLSCHDEGTAHPGLTLKTLKDQREDANVQLRRGRIRHPILIDGKEKTDQGVVTDDRRSQELGTLRRARQQPTYIDRDHTYDRKQDPSRRRARIGATHPGAVPAYPKSQSRRHLNRMRGVLKQPEARKRRCGRTHYRHSLFSPCNMEATHCVQFRGKLHLFMSNAYQWTTGDRCAEYVIFADKT